MSLHRPSNSTVAVIGAGWAGCAAAVECASKGHTVTLIEAARLAGGRARRITQHGHHLDNGQHILLGAYSETMRLMRAVGLKPSELMLRLPVQMRYPDATNGIKFIASPLPAPLHILSALISSQGLSWSDKLALAQFSSAARWMGWQLDHDCSVSELLERFNQTEKLIVCMWRPLCIAALNTPPVRASANVFLSVLRDSLGARRSASDMLLPKQDLTALFPDAAIAYIESQGGKIEFGTRIKQIERSPTGIKITGDDYASEFDAIVIATPPWITQDLMREHDEAIATHHFEYEAITTCYLQYAKSTRLDHAFYTLLDEATDNAWGQFVFDRGYLNPDQAGLFAVVISAANEASKLDHAELSLAVANQLATTFQQPAYANPEWTSIITEKRATFACTPNLDRLPNKTKIDNIVLAGDYTKSDYPATLESAVRSGVQAARLVLN